MAKYFYDPYPKMIRLRLKERTLKLRRGGTTGDSSTRWKYEDRGVKMLQTTQQRDDLPAFAELAELDDNELQALQKTLLSGIRRRDTLIIGSLHGNDDNRNIVQGLYLNRSRRTGELHIEGQGEQVAINLSAQQLASILVMDGLPKTHRRLALYSCYGAGPNDGEAFGIQLAKALGRLGCDQIIVKAFPGLLMSSLTPKQVTESIESENVPAKGQARYYNSSGNTVSHEAWVQAKGTR